MFLTSNTRPIVSVVTILPLPIQHDSWNHLLKEENTFSWKSVHSFLWNVPETSVPQWTRICFNILLLSTWRVIESNKRIRIICINHHAKIPTQIVLDSQVSFNHFQKEKHNPIVKSRNWNQISPHRRYRNYIF